MRALLVAGVVLLSGCGASSGPDPSIDPILPVTAAASTPSTDVQHPAPGPVVDTVVDTQPPAVEVMKDCPLRSLTAIEAMVVVQSAKHQFTPVIPPVGQSVVASVRVADVLWARPEIEFTVGDSFDGLLYAHSTTPEQWGFDDDWLTGEGVLVTGLSANQIREVDVNWEFQSVLIATDGTLRFPVGCFDSRFDDLARRTRRSADLDLYLDLLVEDQTYLDCRENEVTETCVPGLVLAAAFAIDSELPGE